MSYIKADNDYEQQMFDYLEELRQSGETNMFGAAPYLQREFKIPLGEAKRTLVRWMELHDDESRIIK